MRRLLNQMKMHGEMVAQHLAQSTIGIVSSYDPDNYCCKVTLFPEDSVIGSKAVITGWIPIGSIAIGNEWGIFTPPQIGDLVEVNYSEGDWDSAQVGFRFYNDDSRPVHAESGVFYIIHKSGSFLKFENDGNVSIHSAKDLTAIVGENLIANVTGNVSLNATNGIMDIDCPTVNITGDLNVTKNIKSTSGNIEATVGDVKDKKRTMAGDRTIFDNHTHPYKDQNGIFDADRTTSATTTKES